MPRTQPNPIGNDVIPSVLQDNLLELFQFAHDHPVRSSLPTSSQGASGDIITVDDGTNVYICIRTSRGWFRTSALTAI